MIIPRKQLLGRLVNTKGVFNMPSVSLRLKHVDLSVARKSWTSLESCCFPV